MAERVDLTVYCKSGPRINWPSAEIHVDQNFMQFTRHGSESKMYTKRELQLHKKLRISEEQRIVTVKISSEHDQNELFLKIKFSDHSNLSVFNRINNMLIFPRKERQAETDENNLPGIDFDWFIRGKTTRAVEKKMKKALGESENPKDALEISQEFIEIHKNQVVYNPIDWEGELEELETLPFVSHEEEEILNFSPPDSVISIREEGKGEEKSEFTMKTPRIRRRSSTILDKEEPARKSSRQISPKSAFVECFEMEAIESPPASSSIEVPHFEDDLSCNGCSILENQNLFGETIQNTTIINCRIINSKIEKSHLKNCHIENSEIIDSTVTSISTKSAPAHSENEN